jgi:hypothetical protein
MFVRVSSPFVRHLHDMATVILLLTDKGVVWWIQIISITWFINENG